MSMTGRLDEVSVAEVLHLLSWGEKTGKLTLSRGSAEGVVVLRHGRIVNAASNSPREALGSILVCRKLLSENTLLSAVEEARRAPGGRSLGATLVAMGVLDPQDLRAAVREQVEQVITEFFLWESGSFRFEPMQPDEPASYLDTDQGFNTEQVVLEVVKLVDEVRRRREEHAARAGRQVPAALLAEEVRSSPFAPPRPRASSVSAIVADLGAPVLRGEAIAAILAHARTVVRRAVVFIPSHRGFVGSGQFGISSAEGSADEHVRRVVVPLGQPSVLADVAAKRGAYRGILPLSFWNEFLVAQLGGGFPREVAVIPAIVDGTVVALLYGDNVPSGDPIGQIAALEAATLEACARHGRPLAPEEPGGAAGAGPPAVRTAPPQAKT